MADQIEAIIFDMGGVILRTEDKTSRTDLAKKYNLSLSQLEDLVFESPSAMIATVGKISERDHWRTVLDGLKVPEEQRLSFEEAFWQGDALDQTLIDFLRTQKNQRKTALLSNAWSGTRATLTDKHPCLDAFHVSVFSCEVGLAKPDPAIYSLILQQMKVEPVNSIFVDDNEKNILAAAAMGIHAIRFQSTAQALGQIQKLL
jgi:glucose-1-phosphatase